MTRILGKAAARAALDWGCSTILTALGTIIENREHKAATVGRRVVAVHGFLNWCDKSLAHEVFSSLKFRMKRRDCESDRIFDSIEARIGTYDLPETAARSVSPDAIWAAAQTMRRFADVFQLGL
jgi:hypothetical protein